MSTVEIEVVGGSVKDIFGNDSPSKGDRVELGDGVEVEYKSDLAVKSIEGDAFLFAVDFGEFATYATLYKALEKSGAKIVRIAGERVEVNKEAIRDRLDEILEN